MLGNLVDRVRAGARSDFAKSSLLVFVALICASALYYGFYLVMGHTLTVAAYGTAMSLVSVSLLAATPASIGQTIIAKIVAQRASRERFRIPREIALQTAAVALAAALAIVLAGAAWRVQVAQYLRLDHAEYVILTAIATALCLVMFLGRGLLQGAQLFKAFAVSNVLDGSLRFVLVLLLTQRFGIGGALSAMALAFAAAVGYGAIVVVRHMASVAQSAGAEPAKVPSAVVATGSISFAMIALGYYDSILVKHYLLPADAGVYGVISLAGRTVAIVLSFVPIVLLPYVTERTLNGLSSRAMLGMSLVLSAVISVLATLGCALAAPLVVRILAGPSFAAAIPLLAVYVAAASCLAIANVLAAYLIGKHDYRVIPPLSAVAAGEVAAVIYRHLTVLDVVQDVLVGHAAIASVMALAVLVRFVGYGHGRRVKVAT